MSGPEPTRRVREGAVAEFRKAERMAEERRSTKFGAPLLVQHKLLRPSNDFEELDDDDEPEELPLRYTRASALQPLLAFPLRQWPNVPTKNSSSTFVNLRLAQEDRRLDIFAVSKAVASIRVSSIESVTRVSAEDLVLNGCACLLAFHTEENATDVEILLRACLSSPTFSLVQGMTVIHAGHLSMKKSALAWSGRYAKMVKGRFLLFAESETKLPSEVLPIGKMCFVRPQGDRILEVKFTHGFALMFRADSRTDRNQWVSAFAAEKKEMFNIGDLCAEPSLHKLPDFPRLDRPTSLPSLEDASYSSNEGYMGPRRNQLPEFLNDEDFEGEGYADFRKLEAMKRAPLDPSAGSTRKRTASSQSLGSHDLIRIVKDVKPKGSPGKGSPGKGAMMMKPIASPDPLRLSGSSTGAPELSRVPSFGVDPNYEYRARISTHSSFKFNDTRYKGGAQPLDKSKAQLCTELANHSLRWSFSPLEAPCPMIAAVQTTTPGTNTEVILIPELQPLLARSNVSRVILRIIPVGDAQEENWFVAESFHGGDEVKSSLLEASAAQPADSKQRFSVLKSKYSRHSNNLTVSGWAGKTKDQAIALSVYALADAGILVPAGRAASVSRKMSEIPPPPDSPVSSVLPPPSPSLVSVMPPPPPSPSLSRMSYHGTSDNFDLDDLALPATPTHDTKHAAQHFSFLPQSARSTLINTNKLENNISPSSSVISFLSASSTDNSPHAPLLAGLSMNSSAPSSSRANKYPPPPICSPLSTSPSSPAYFYSDPQPLPSNISPPLASSPSKPSNSSYSYSSAFSGPAAPTTGLSSPLLASSSSNSASNSSHASSSSSAAATSSAPPAQSASSSSSSLLRPSSSVVVEPSFQKSIQLRMWTEDDCHDLESFLSVPERHLAFRSRLLCLHEEIGEISETDPAAGNTVWSPKVLRLFAHRMSIHKSLKEQLPELVFPLGCKGGKFVAEGPLIIKIVAHRKLWLRSASKEVHEQWLKAFTMERVLSQGVLAPSLTVESLTSDEVQKPKTPDPLIALKLKHLTRSHLNKQDIVEQRPSANLFTDEVGNVCEQGATTTTTTHSHALTTARSRAASPSPFPIGNGEDEEIAITLEQAFLDPFILALYEKFAKDCFEAENIAYILEVRKFEDMMDIAAVVWRPDNEANTQAKAQEIYTKFVQEGSDLELNIIHTIRQDLRNVFQPKINQGEDVPLTRGMFDAVTHEIMRLMRTNSWIRFRNSEYWAKVVDHVLEEGDQAHMGPLIPPFAGEFDSQQSFFGSCRRLGQHPVCFMSPVWTYEQWIKESAADFFHWRGEKTQKLDDLVKAHTATFDGCVTLLKGAKLVLVDAKDESGGDTQIGFSYPGFASEVVEVGSISVVSVWQLIADASDLSFQSHDWDAALAASNVGKLLMQTSPDVSDLYDKGPVGVKEAKALMSAAQLEVLHNVCLAAFIHSKGGPSALDPDESCELKWSNLLETRGEANRDRLEEWDNLVYEVKPKWFFMIEMVRMNDPYHNALLGPSEFVLCMVVLLNLRLASVVNLKSYLTIWLAEHKKKAGVSRYQAAVELMEGATQEERELVRVLVQLPSFGNLTGTAVLHAFPLDVYAPVAPPATRSRTQTTGALKERGRGSAAGWGYGSRKVEEASTSTSPPTSPPLNPIPNPAIIATQSAQAAVRQSLRFPKPPLTTYPTAATSSNINASTSAGAPSTSTTTTTTTSATSSLSVASSSAHINHHTASRASSLFAFFPSFKSLMSTHAIPATSTVLKAQVAADAAAAALKRSPQLRTVETGAENGSLDQLQQQKQNRAASIGEQQQQNRQTNNNEPLLQKAGAEQLRTSTTSTTTTPTTTANSNTTTEASSSFSSRKNSPSPSGRRYSSIANAKPKQPPPPVPKKNPAATPGSPSLYPSSITNAIVSSTPAATTNTATTAATTTTPSSSSATPSTVSVPNASASPASSAENFVPAVPLSPISEETEQTPRARARSLKTPSKAAPTRRNTREAVSEMSEEGSSRGKPDERRSQEDMLGKKAPLRQPPPPPGSIPNVLPNVVSERSSGERSDRGSTSSIDGRQTPKAPTKQAPVAPPRPISPGPIRPR